MSDINRPDTTHPTLAAEIDPFDQLDAKDGFHVVMIATKERYSLYCHAYHNGQLCNLFDPSRSENATVLLVYSSGLGDAAYGHTERLRLVFEAIARYLNTGGTWDEFDVTMQNFRQVAVGNLVFPGYCLVDSYPINGEGVFQHIFHHNISGGGAVWEEPMSNPSGGLNGGWVERKTVEQIEAEQNDDAAIWGELEADE